MKKFRGLSNFSDVFQMISNEVEIVIMKLTKSVCPGCKRVIIASIYDRNGKMLIEKDFPENGNFRDVYWPDVELYNKFETAHILERGF